jgi:uncharacterized protein (TIGR00251 family)
MRLFIKARPNSKEDRVEEVDNTHFIIHIKAIAKEGDANRSVIKVVAKYLEIAPSQIILISGHKSREKVLEVLI